MPHTRGLHGRGRTIVAKREGAGLLVVTVAGVLDADSGKTLDASVRAELAMGPIERVLVDLRGLTNCELLGRAALTDLQTWLRSRVKRTAYVTATPRFRGMTHIVIHNALDENAATFVQRAEADAWLGASELRQVVHARVLGGKS